MKNTTLCYIEENGSYLMLHRTKKRADANAGKWIGVGGKVEPDESPDDCLPVSYTHLPRSRRASPRALRP